MSSLETHAHIKRLLDSVPEKFFSIEQEASVDVLERLGQVEQALANSSTQLELLRQNSASEGEIRRQDAAARLTLLGRITWTATAVVVGDLGLLALVVHASVYTSYKPDEWFVRLLAGGPVAAIVGMLGAIVAHYWPRPGSRPVARRSPIAVKTISPS